jgi:hypothetical protein
MALEFLDYLSIVSSLVFLIGVYFAFKLSKETRHEKYWLYFVLGFFIFAIHHWMMIPLNFGLSNEIQEIIEHTTSIIGALFIGYATFGLYNSMRKIRKRLE